MRNLVRFLPIARCITPIVQMEKLRKSEGLD